MSVSEPLKPCPFCGNPTTALARSDLGPIAIRCNSWKCGATGPYGDSRAQAEGEWNARVPQ